MPGLTDDIEDVMAFRLEDMQLDDMPRLERDPDLPDLQNISESSGDTTFADCADASYESWSGESENSQYSHESSSDPKYSYVPMHEMHPREFEQVIAQWNDDYKEQRASASPKAKRRVVFTQRNTSHSDEPQEDKKIAEEELYLLEKSGNQQHRAVRSKLGPCQVLVICISLCTLIMHCHIVAAKISTNNYNHKEIPDLLIFSFPGAELHLQEINQRPISAELHLLHFKQDDQRNCSGTRVMKIAKERLR